MKKLIFILLLITSIYNYGQYSTLGTEFNFAFIQNRIDRNGAETNCYLNNYINNYISIVNNTGITAHIQINFNGAPVYYRINGIDHYPSSGNTIEYYLPGDTSIILEIYPYDSLHYTNECYETIDIYDPRVFQAMNNCQIEHKVITIKSLNDIPLTVFAENSQSNSRDVSMILPNNALGNIYYLFSTFPNPLEYPTQHAGENLGGPSEAVILAIYDSTVIHINLPENVPNTTPLYSNVDAYGIDTMYGNSHYTLVLNQGEIFQMQSDNFSLTGTFISGTKPFAVFSGNMANKYNCSGTCGYDHIYEQMLPMKNWGTHYIVTPLHDGKEEKIKIISMYDNNNISINGSTITLNQGEMYETTIYEDQTLDLEGTMQFCVVQITSSSEYVSNNHTANDPSMVVLTPLSQPIERIILSIPIKLPTSNASACDNVSKKDYINIVAKTDMIDSIYVDDFTNPACKISDYPNLVTDWTTVQYNPDYSYAIIDVTNSSTITSKPVKLYDISYTKSGFNAIVSGFDCAEGYSFNAGILVTIDSTYTDDCLNETPEIKIYPNPFRDFFTVDIQNEYHIDIYSSTGTLVYSKELKGKHKINTSNLPQGAYIVKIIQGQKLYYKSIIKINGKR